MIFFPFLSHGSQKEYSRISMNELHSKEKSIAYPISGWLLQTEAYVTLVTHKTAAPLTEHL